jgi:hypothetical protein
MPLFEYILLGLLGSGGATVLDGASPAGPLTMGADAIVQPNGGVVALAGQETPKKDDSRTKQHSKIRARQGHIKGETQKSTRHHRRRHHRQSRTFQK